MRKQMFREGARLQYLSLIPKIVDEEGPLAYEEKITDTFLKEIIKDNGLNAQLKKENMLAIISKQGSFRYCLKVAEILGLVKLEGTSKGIIRRQLIRNTGLGRSIYLSKKMFNSEDLISLSSGGKFLFLKKFIDIEEEWKGGWVINILEICNRDNSWIEELELINRFSESVPAFKNLSPRSRQHRVFPRIQWLFDLEILLINHDKNKRWYKISNKGKKILNLWNKYTWNIPSLEILNLYYRIKNGTNDMNTNFEKEIPNFYNEIKKQIPVDTLPSISIEVLLNLFTIKKAIQGYFLSRDKFIDALYKLHLKSILSLFTSPSDRMEGIMIDKVVYKLAHLNL